MADSVTEIVPLALELEENINASAFAIDWFGTRNDWRIQLESNTVPVPVLLVQLEGAALWPAMKSQWKGIRPGWMNFSNGKSSKFFAFDTNPERPLQEVKEKLLQFEDCMYITALKDGWSDMRDEWIQNVNKSSNFQELGTQLGIFESNIKLSVMNDKWKGLRTSWRTKLTNENPTFATVGHFLLSIEGKLSWNAVNENWRAVRDTWAKMQFSGTLLYHCLM